MRQQGFNALVYVDDFVGCEESLVRARRSTTSRQYAAGWAPRLAADKCVALIPSLVWLGFEICVERMTLGIPDGTLRAVLEECDQWLARPTMTRRALQSLLGCLAHIANCIPPEWRFMNRLLAGHRGLCGLGPAAVDPEIHWFRDYAALGSFTITICHKPGADLIFKDALSRAHASLAALEFVARYCVSHNVARIRITHNANGILSHFL